MASCHIHPNFLKYSLTKDGCFNTNYQILFAFYVLFSSGDIYTYISNHNTPDNDH